MVTGLSRVHVIVICLMETQTTQLLLQRVQLHPLVLLLLLLTPAPTLHYTSKIRLQRGQNMLGRSSF